MLKTVHLRPVTATGHGPRPCWQPRRTARVDHAAVALHVAEVVVSSGESVPSAGGGVGGRTGGRRSLALAAAAAAAALAFGPAPARADADAPTDILEGTQRWADLGRQAIGAQLQQAAGGDDEAADAALQERRRRFGVITVPGLSSFSFIHGLLVGTAAIAFFWTGIGSGSTTTSGSGSAQQGGSGRDTPGLDPELEAALRAALADAGETFHDPVVHEAVEDVRRDVANISKYRDNPSVMAAFRKLLEIEGILERL